MKRKRVGIEAMLKPLAMVLVLAAGLAAYGQSAPGPEGRSIGVLYLVQEPQLVTQNVTASGYQEVFGQYWKEIGREHGFRVLEASRGTALETGSAGLLRLLSEGVDAIVISRIDPAAPLPPLPELEDITVPVLLSGYQLDSGYRESGNVSWPYVGFDGYADGKEIGRQSAELFRKRNPEARANVVAVAVTNLEVSGDRLRGFREGFSGVLPDSVLLDVVETTGDIADGTSRVQAALVKFPEVNVLFGAGVNPTMSILASFTEAEQDEGRGMVIAGFSTSEEPAPEITGGPVPVDVVALLPARELVEKSFEVLELMLDRSGSGDIASEYLVKSRVVSGITGTDTGGKQEERSGNGSGR